MKKKCAQILEIIRRFLLSDELLMMGRLNETAFTRKRMLTFEKITLFIVNLVRKTLQLELNLIQQYLSFLMKNLLQSFTQTTK